MKEKIRFPRIGLRIVKSSIAILLCYLVFFLRGNGGIVFYSQLSCLWCIQMYTANTWKNAVQRTIGTVIGALYGLIYLLGRNAIVHRFGQHSFANAVVVSGMIMIILYTTVLIKKKQASYFSCVVFLSIVVNHITDNNPYLFVWNRFLDTMIGIGIGLLVNTFHLPRDMKKDTLFISGMDDLLVEENEVLSDYSRVELNRMLDSGANFTISTMRTPASLIDPLRDIRLKLPVIAMDGAVLYDIQNKSYLKAYVISNYTAKQVLERIHAAGFHCFTNVLLDDMLVIYYDQTEDEVQKKLIADLRRSPYRNYVCRELPENEDVIYFMLLYPTEQMERFYQQLKDDGITEQLKVLYYASHDYPGYSYIKIYNSNARKENMIEYLKKELQIEKTMTFGTVKGKYDQYIEPGEHNRLVYMLKKQYEPLKFIGNHSLDNQ